MQTSDLLEIKVGDPSGVHGLSVSYKMGHLRKSVDHDED